MKIRQLMDDSINLKRPKGISGEQWKRAQQLYVAAKNIGDKFPELTVAQAALETGWFKKESGENNFFGQKATPSQAGSNLTTHEISNGNRIKTVARFRDYKTVESSLEDRKRKWISKYNDASTPMEALGKIWKYDENKKQGTGYATDPNYGSKISKILTMMGVDNNDYNKQSSLSTATEPTSQNSETLPEEELYNIEYPERKIDNTFVPANYTTIPEKEVEKKKPLTEQDLRKILEEEKNNNVKIRENNFVNAFKQQTQPQQDLSNYQPQQQDLSHLYNYIQPEDDSFYTQGFADGGQLSCGGPGQPPCDEDYYKIIRNSRGNQVRKNSDGTVSTHLMADNNKDKAFPTLFRNEDGTWDDYSNNHDKAFERATKDNEIYTFPNQKELFKFAREGSWKNNFAEGGSLNDDCGGPGQPPCEEINTISNNKKVSKEDEDAIFEYLNNLDTDKKDGVANNEVKSTDPYGRYRNLITETDKNNLKKDLEKDTLQTSSSLYVPTRNIPNNIQIDESKVSKENPFAEIKKEEQELNKSIEDRYNSIAAKENVNLKTNLESKLQQNDTSLYTPTKENLNISNVDNQNKIVSYKRESDKGFNKEEVTKIQTRLQELGYDIGKYGADGKIGKDTRNAIIQLQKDKKLKTDGVVGKDTVAALSGYTTGSIKDILKGEKPVEQDSINYFQQVMNTHYKDTPEEATGIWDKNSKKSFYEFKKMIAGDTQNRFKPAISRTFSALDGKGSNLTEKNFSSSELDKMRKLAIKDGKLQSSFGYDDIREGTDLKGSQVSDILASVYEKPSSLYSNKEEITLLLTLGQAGIMEGPDGNVYVYDVYDFNDVGDISDGRSPEEVYNDRLKSMKIDPTKYEEASTKEKLKMSYQMKRAKASYEQRKQQLLSKEKGEKWKPTAALINLGKKSDLLSKVNS